MESKEARLRARHPEVKRLEALRKRAGLSQMAVDRMLGLTPYCDPTGRRRSQRERLLWADLERGCCILRSGEIPRIRALNERLEAEVGEFEVPDAWLYQDVPWHWGPPR